MADLIVECVRQGTSLHTEDQFRSVAARLSPPGITPRPPHVLEAPGLRAMVVNPSPHAVPPESGGVLTGAMETGVAWRRTGGGHPEGTYALVRYDDEALEALADIAASRGLWYAFDHERLLVSTSQRALVALLGTLEPDPAAATWLVTCGALGPDTAWDARVRHVPRDGLLRLERRDWGITLDYPAVIFEPGPGSNERRIAELREAIAQSCAALDLDDRHWLLPLSGGADSRYIAAAMAGAGRRIDCVTWTTRGSRRTPLSDGWLAPLLARHFGLSHRFLYLDDAADTSASVDLFVAAGEGRSDAYSAYVDGQAAWRDLFAAGSCGVVRGDDSFFHYQPPASAASARMGAGSTMLQDFAPTHLVHRLGLAPHTWPARLERRPAESLADYYHRLDQENYATVALSPLNDLKGRYVEVVNPLLSRRIVQLMRTMPQALRLHGRAFMSLADRAAPLVPYARFGSVPEPDDYLAQPGMVDLLVRDLTASAVPGVVGEEGAMNLLAALATPAAGAPALRARAVAAIKASRVVVPTRLAERFVPPYRGPDALPAARVAFRAVLAARTLALLREDAALLSREPTATR